jgi:hypothetical protein
VQTVRAAWHDRTQDVRERATFAGDELERRGLDRDTAAPVGEQHELFAIANPTNPATTDEPAADAAARSGSAGPGRTRQAPTATPTATPTAIDTAIDTGADGYAAVFAEADRAAERHRHQPPLFDLQPTPADVAAAQPLRGAPAAATTPAATTPAGAAEATTEPAGTAADPSAGNAAAGAAAHAEPGDTVRQVQRQAQIIAALRDNIAAARRGPPITDHEHHDEADAEHRRHAGAGLDAAEMTPDATAQHAQHQGLSH